MEETMTKTIDIGAKIFKTHFERATLCLQGKGSGADCWFTVGLFKNGDIVGTNGEILYCGNLGIELPFDRMFLKPDDLIPFLKNIGKKDSYIMTIDFEKNKMTYLSNIVYFRPKNVQYPNYTEIFLENYNEEKTIQTFSSDTIRLIGKLADKDHDLEFNIRGNRETGPDPTLITIKGEYPGKIIAMPLTNV